MNVRAKFRVSQVNHTQPKGASATIILRPVSADDVPENQRFHKYSPSGELSMQVDNQAVVEEMQVGNVYYLDFTPVPAS